MNEYRKEHNLPSYREERRIRKVSIEELAAKNKELEKRLKQKEKELADEKETVEILKKNCTSLTPAASAAALGHRKIVKRKHFSATLTCTLLCDHTTEMRGDTREPQEILSQEDVQSPGNTAVFLLPVVTPARKAGREEGP